MDHAGINWERQSTVKRFNSSTRLHDGPLMFNVAKDGIASESFAPIE